MYKFLPKHKVPSSYALVINHSWMFQKKLMPQPCGTSLKIYMTKSLANLLYMKQYLYSFKIGDDKNVHVQIYKFIKILDDLENIDVKMEDEDKAP